MGGFDSLNSQALWNEVQSLRKTLESPGVNARLEAEADPETAEVASPAGMLSAADLAATHTVPLEALRKRLERFRRQHLDHGWREVTERRPREPRYLYDTRAVESLIAELRSSSGS